MRKILVVAVIVTVTIAVIGATTAVQASEAGRQNTTNALLGGQLVCNVFNCRQVVSNIFRSGTTTGGGGYFSNTSAGEEAAYLRGQSDALAELQAIREQRAYELGRGSVGNSNIGFSNFKNFGTSSCYGC